MDVAAMIDGHEAGSVALVVGDRAVTYGELRERVDRLATALAASVPRPGERVALACGNHDGFVVAYLAIARAGLVAVPLNPSSPAPELARQLQVVRAVAAIADPRPGASMVAAGAVDGPVVVVGDAPDGTIGLEAFAASAPSARPSSTIAPDDPAVLLFTSGTAGPPRAATLTHANLLANLDQLIAHPGGLADEPRVALGVLPLHHVFGLNAVLGLSLRLGGAVVLHEGLDPERVAADVVAHGVSVVAGAPAMWRSLAESGVGAAAMAGVRFATSGADHLPGETADLVRERLGVELRQGYGLTEASPVVSSAVGTDASASSVGVPLPGVQVRLVDGSGDDVLVNDEGEVWVRGPNVFAGYWDDPAATAAVMASGGWLRTGDIGVVDERGRLYLVDRAKDLVIVSGFNVHPTEVEAVLAAHPSVRAAAVVGEPDPRTGEAVVAHVVPEPGSGIDAATLIDHCRDQLARYKCPRRIELVTEIPTGLNGKTLRRELRSPGG